MVNRHCEKAIGTCVQGHAYRPHTHAYGQSDKVSDINPDHIVVTDITGSLTYKALETARATTACMTRAACLVFDLTDNLTSHFQLNHAW